MPHVIHDAFAHGILRQQLRAGRQFGELVNAAWGKIGTAFADDLFGPNGRLKDLQGQPLSGAQS